MPDPSNSAQLQWQSKPLQQMAVGSNSSIVVTTESQNEEKHSWWSLIYLFWGYSTEFGRMPDRNIKSQRTRVPNNQPQSKMTYLVKALDYRSVPLSLNTPSLHQFHGSELSQASPPHPSQWVLNPPSPEEQSHLGTPSNNGAIERC